LAVVLRVRGLGDLSPVVPAPMSGYTDRAWREIARAMGCELVVVPLISAEGLVRAQPKTLELLDIEGEQPPVSVQLFGNRPESLAEAAKRIEQIGVQAVDINLGCPARKVVRHNAGAAALKRPDIVAQLVGAVRRAVSITLTVKMRAGWDKSENTTAELARVIEAQGADAIALHARTGCQQFKGAADWNSIAEAKAAVHIPVIGNGDVRSGEDAWRMHCQTGCDGVMIGRAAVGNPWLWRDALAWLAAKGQPPQPLVPPTVHERLDMLAHHACLIARHRGEPRGIVEFRKHAIQYIKGMRQGKSLKEALVTCTTAADIEQAVEAYRLYTASQSRA